MLANLGGEQLYLFDLQESDKPKRLDLDVFTNMGCVESEVSSLAASESPKRSDVDTAKETTTTTTTTTTITTTAEDDNDSGVTATYSESLESYETNIKHMKLGDVEVAPVTAAASSSSSLGADSSSSSSSRHSAVIESLKEKGNQAFNRQHYSSAIALYNEALAAEPGSIIFANRAAALMKRGWDGDLYAALRDCHEALKGESLPSVKCKAHFRLAKCLYDLQWTDEALQCIERFKIAFPDHAAKPPCETLCRDIKATLFGFKGRESSSKGDKVEGDVGGVGEDDDGGEEEDFVGGGGGERPTARRRPPKRSGRPVDGFRLSEKETNWRTESKDYKLRFAGHCNTTTDIKEANFFGANGQFIVAGSDDGSFFVWDRYRSGYSGSTSRIPRIVVASR